MYHIKLYSYFQSINNNIKRIKTDKIDLVSLQLDNNSNIIYKCIKSCCKKFNGGICKCKSAFESIYHYLFTCILYNEHRTIFFSAIMPILNHYTIQCTIRNFYSHH